MMRKVTGVFAAIAILFGIASTPTVAAEGDDLYKYLALQISDNDPATMNKVLNVASNFSRNMSEKGFEPIVEIVAFNAGLHMLRTDTSPVLERIDSMNASYPNLTFTACGNTMTLMGRKEGAVPPISEHAVVATAGVVRLMELDAEGFFVIRP